MRICFYLLVMAACSLVVACKSKPGEKVDNGSMPRGHEMEWPEAKKLRFIPGDDLAATPISFGDLDMTGIEVFFFEPSDSVSLEPTALRTQEMDSLDTDGNCCEATEQYREVPVAVKHSICFFQPNRYTPSPVHIKSTGQEIPSTVSSLGNYHTSVQGRCFTGWVVVPARVNCDVCPHKKSACTATFSFGRKEYTLRIDRPATAYRISTGPAVAPCDSIAK